MKSNDLESAASVPGTNIVLFAESGDDNTVEAPTNPQIYKARLTRNGVRIVGVTPWPAMIFNVEATAVAQLGENYVFLYAERADGQASTDLNWASFDPNTMEFGEFSFVTFNSPDPAAYNRPLVAMDLDSSGQIYIASAFDPENAFPDSIADNGPFASAVYRIGQLVEVDGEPRVELYPPVFEGQCDGFKVESVAIRETEEEGLRIFVGVDDENYGATMRQLPPLPQAP